MAILNKTFTREECKKPNKSNEDVCEIFKKTPWQDKTIFSLTPDKKRIITGNSTELERGICTARAGDFARKERLCSSKNLMREKYPNNNSISLFDEMSYHGSKSRGESKINQYGTNKYNLEFSKLTPKVKNVKLDSPVKTQTKKEFGKLKSSVTLHEKDYVVIDWKPENNKVCLRVKQTKEDIFGNTKKVFESKEFCGTREELEKRSKEPIKIFKNRVNKLN